MATTHFEPQEVEVFDERLLVYKRTVDANVLAFRANIDGVRGYIRRSPKQADFTLAVAEANKSEGTNPLQEAKRLCKEFGFTAGMLKGAFAEGRIKK
jgi:hypothetical protein